MASARNPLRSLSVWVGLLIALTSFAACAPTISEGSPERPESVAVLDVNVVPMDSERILRNHTVVVVNGLISNIGPSGSVEVPRGARRIDGAGQYLLPGLIDSHVHLRDTSELLSYLAHGVTTVVHLSGPLANVPNVLDLRSRVARRDVIGPTIYTSGRILDGDPAVYPGVSVTIRTAEEARSVVVDQIAAGVDFVKVYNNLSTAALQATVKAAHDRQVAVFGHVPRAEGRAGALQTALQAGLDVVAHGEEFFFTFFYGDVEGQLDHRIEPRIDESRIPEAVRLTKAAGAAVTPNLSFVFMTRVQLDDPTRVFGDPESHFLVPPVLNMWRQQNPTTRPDLDRFNRRERAKYRFVQRLTAALSDAGVPLLLGTDASTPGLFPGKSAHIELLELVKAGLTPYHALEAGTRSAGKFIATHTNTIPPFGTITPGSRADFMLLRRNPLEDVANVAALEGVLVAGAWFTAADLHRMRDTAAQSPTK